jgi:hypothetical protein
MGHCIHAIVAARPTADVISAAWPELPRLDRDNGFAVFAVDAELIDARIAPDETPVTTGNEFKLLTDGLRALLKTLSRDGQLAYIETDYFGGVGGQGALVCRAGEEIMSPTWQKSGAIDKALKLIGLPRGILADRFAAAGFAQIRNNDDLLTLIEDQAAGP